MAMTAAERKAAQRARQASEGQRKIELHLDAQELEMLERNRATRRPGREPYDAAEYIAMLIRQDDARARMHIRSISRRRCGRCGDPLPVSECSLDSESQCWVNRGWHEIKLNL